MEFVNLYHSRQQFNILLLSKHFHKHFHIYVGYPVVPTDVQENVYCWTGILSSSCWWPGAKAVMASFYHKLTYRTW